MSTVLRTGFSSNGQTAAADLDARIALIQALIPLGLRAVEDVLQHEVQTLAGPRYARGDGAPHLVRWGRQRGSVYLADQKLPIQVPRVRNRQAGFEVPLQSYQRLQQPRAADEGMLRRVLYGLSCRDYSTAAEAVPEAFGLSRSSISRRYIRATARQLQTLQERRLDSYDLAALVLDGKIFADDTMVIALGITLRGEKVLLGFVQTGTENATACAAFLRGLRDRGLRVTDGLLVVLDGSKGLRRAVQDVFAAQVQIQRCTWHKRENVVAYLPKHLQPAWRAKLHQAYRQPSYTAALELPRFRGHPDAWGREPQRRSPRCPVPAHPIPRSSARKLSAWRGSPGNPVRRSRVTWGSPTSRCAFGSSRPIWTPVGAPMG